MAARAGRRIRFGLRLHLVVRETTRKAWEEANDLMRYVTDHAVEIAQSLFGRHDSEGQRRMVQLHKGRRGEIEVSPNLWAGIGLVRGGAGTALVGDPKVVAARIREYEDLGIDTFIFSGYPHLGEAYRVAELLLPEPMLIHRDGSRPVRQHWAPRLVWARQLITCKALGWRTSRGMNMNG